MEKVRIGIVVGTFGVKGELKIRSTTDFEDQRFVVGNKVFLVKNNQEQELEIASIRYHQNNYLISFVGFEDLTSVENFKQSELYAPQLDSSVLKKGEYFFTDLINLKVIYNQKEIGYVTEIIEGAAQPLLKVKMENKTVLIPYVKALIKKVDLKKQEIEVVYLEGLV